MGQLRGTGRRTRVLEAALVRREGLSRERRRALDERALSRLAQPRAVVYTDTADFTRRAARDGILHFMMVFGRALRALTPAFRRERGRLVKVEADSLMLAFPDAASACRGALAMERALRALNRGRDADETLAFSYGVGYGDVLELEEDLFGLEVNLASKLGEDLGRPGEVLLTPAAVAGLPAAWRKRLVAYGDVNFAGRPMAVHRLRPARGGA